MLQPLGKRIIIEPIQKPNESILLQLKKEPITTFKVIAVGDEVKKVIPTDNILVDHYAVSETIYNDVIYYMIHEDNIHAKIKAS
jgi:co-chaperonin GroES (HSP10)